ncbi:hypothetical protein PoB_006992400 [Plakobranchus ocellatus]|uniref:Uncharacterized protein n=1 Tax=Plakobranchus ocellatus TaxID=259542 RepID=A0AAV4DGX7_9GAST|nr:hypothetical protein PoB_006992400 [Plakobranchus ocellatus]
MPRDQYVCGLDGHWQNNMDRWPDCSNSYTRVGVVRDTSYSLRDLYPNSSFCEAHRLSLRLRVLTRVSRVLRTRCSDPGICSIVKLNVTCFQYDEVDPYYYDSNEPPRVPSYEPTLNYTLKVDSASHSMDYNLGVLENVSLELRDILRNFLNLSQESGLLGEPRGVDCKPGYQHLADVLCSEKIRHYHDNLSIF